MTGSRPEELDVVDEIDGAVVGAVEVAGDLSFWRWHSGDVADCTRIVTVVLLRFFVSLLLR